MPSDEPKLRLAGCRHRVTPGHFLIQIVAVPDFIVLGAVKTGTTSLYHYLRQHPEIQMGRKNWPRFFHVDGGEPDFERLRAAYGDHLLPESLQRYRTMCHAGIPRSLGEYERLWPPETPVRIRGEVSPTYLHDAVALARIRRRLPAVKLIVILRQPAARAWSHFIMDLSRGWAMDRSFTQALEREPVEIDEFWWGKRHYCRHGLYARQLGKLFKLFEPQQLKFFLYDDYLSAPQEFMGELFSFIGADPGFRVDMSTHHNQLRLISIDPANIRENTGKMMNVPPLHASIQRPLTEFFRADITVLQDLVHRDLSAWLQ